MQWALVKRVLVHWLTFFALLLVVLGVAHYFKSLLFPAEDVWWSFVAQNWLVFLLLIAAIPVFIYDTLKMSNRFAGPLARLRESLRELAAGDTVKPLVLRRGDYITDIVEDFNAVISHFESIGGESPTTANQADEELEVVQR